MKKEAENHNGTEWVVGSDANIESFYVSKYFHFLYQKKLNSRCGSFESFSSSFACLETYKAKSQVVIVGFDGSNNRFPENLLKYPTPFP